MTRYADLALSALTQYCYTLRAFRTTGTTTYSASSAAVCATTPAPPAPAAPSNVAATAASDMEIDVSWRDNSTNETGFEVQRSVDGPSGTFVAVATTGAGSTPFADVALTPSTQYCYAVRASNTAGGKTTYSALSAPACATTAPPSPPAAPSNVRVYVVSDTRLDVYWQDNSTSETGFEIYRSSNGPGGTFALAAATGADNTARVDIGLSAGTQYCYEVRAVRTIGNTILDSAFSSAVCATTLPPPQPPGLHIKTVTTGDPPSTSSYWVDIWAYDSYWREFTYVTGMSVPTNDTVTITTLNPFDYRLDFGGYPFGCIATSPTTRYVTIGTSFQPGVTAEFDVECHQIPPATLAVAIGEDANSEIYTIDSNGQNLARLTLDPAWDTAPSWSPDGTKIAFESNRTGSPEVFVMNADGTGVLQLTSSSGGNSRPAWSPDGSQIAFTSHRDGNGEIYAVHPDGMALVNLTNQAADDGDPAWSPDGTRIAFRSNRDGDYAGIYIMNADGSGASRLTMDANVVDSQPTWSPDGAWIATARYSCADSCLQTLWLISLDDLSATEVSALNPDCQSHSDPAWSRDGFKLAFTETDSCSGGSSVRLFRLYGVDNGTDGTLLTPGSSPSWRP